MTCEKSSKDSAKITASFLKQGKIVIMPTDTVYGFSGIVDLNGSPLFSTDDKIRKIKGRSETKPFICLLSSVDSLKDFTDDEIPEKILRAWPGALTAIVKIKASSPLAKIVPTMAFRIPGDEWAREVVRETGAPIYSTSVNRSGFPVLSALREIEKEFSSEADLIVQDGDKPNAIPSTIVSLDNGKITILRQGAVKID